MAEEEKEKIITEQIKARDPYFNVYQFKKFINDVWWYYYVYGNEPFWNEYTGENQNSNKKEIHYQLCSERFFEKECKRENKGKTLGKMLKGYYKNLENHKENINVQQIILDKITIKDNNELVDVRVIATLDEFNYRKSTGVKGVIFTTKSPTGFIMRFLRRLNQQTPKSGIKTTITNCPNCGAKYKYLNSYKCEYCGSKKIMTKEIWALDKFEIIHTDHFLDGVDTH